MRYSEREIRQRLSTDDHLAETALEILYRRQTRDERAGARTVWLNERGFNQDDAPVLTPLARRVWRGQPLSKTELNIARYRLPKYARQVADYLNRGEYAWA